ncbi:MAG TPA: hypothetical protein VG389_06450 [Myxococcota bacterium]|jgi:hypothetical protein|nr:hypothetical protein [Myxococcota bacterium]
MAGRCRFTEITVAADGAASARVTVSFGVPGWRARGDAGAR